MCGGIAAPKLRQTRITFTHIAVDLVADGILVGIILMIFLRGVEGTCRHYFRHNRFRKCFRCCNGPLGCFRQTILFSIVEENSSAVFRSNITELSVNRSRVDIVSEDV